ncbi:alpha/beta hydrolase [Portibacter marinus]|uniref:alpha/beta hydrolase n=1 Tax=Portibacter marinus TaxID=2898660 RepID=UPI001F3378F3|nr:alpha/beta fold hydrolase [Portibacter marinus]
MPGLETMEQMDYMSPYKRDFKMQKSLFMLPLMIFLASCQDLAPLLFNPKTDFEEYQWSAYPDNAFFDKEQKYTVPSEEFHYFTLESDHEGQVETIHALYLGDIDQIDTDTVIVFNHGNSGSMDTYYPWAQLLYHAGGKSRYGVMMMDYRGFGLSTGSPSESALMSDVDACLQWLKNRGLTDERLILYGYSLGSIPSVYLAANPRSMKAHKLMLEAPIGSINTMAANGSMLSLPASFYADLETHNIEEIKKVDQDLFWIHGQSDNFLNYYTHGEPIYRNHGGTYKVAVPVRYADHHNCPFMYGEERYCKSIHEFIRHQN